MKKILVLFSCAMILWSCDFKSDPYLKYDMKYEKLRDGCANQKGGVTINSTTISDQYVFEECLNADFDGGYSVERKGDTIDVRIGKRSAEKALYQITLEINTRPAYNFLTVNGNTMSVLVTRH